MQKTCKQFLSRHFVNCCRNDDRSNEKWLGSSSKQKDIAYATAKTPQSFERLCQSNKSFFCTHVILKAICCCMLWLHDKYILSYTLTISGFSSHIAHSEPVALWFMKNLNKLKLHPEIILLLHVFLDRMCWAAVMIGAESKLPDEIISLSSSNRSRSFIHHVSVTVDAWGD